MYVRTYVITWCFLFHYSLDEESVKRIIYQTLKAVNYIHLNNVSELALISQDLVTTGEESLLTIRTSHP